MDYEKAYKEALKRAKSKIKNNKDHVLYEDDIIEILPELKNNDEKIKERILFSLRKDLLAAKTSGCNTKDLEECIDWLEKTNKAFTQKDVDNAYLKGISDTKNELEKQGEENINPYSGTSFEYNGHTFGMCVRDNGVEILMDGELKALVSSEKSFVYPIHRQPKLAHKSALEVTKEEKIDNANKVESKFKVGDWIIDNQGITHKIANVIENVTNHTYGYDIVGGGYFNDNIEGVRLWTIQDAKDGDVLQLGEVTAIFKKYIGNEHCTYYCSFCKAEGFEIPIAKKDNVYGCYNATPATKEQLDLLFQKMKEAGYEWDTEKKELKKIHNALEECEIEHIEHGKYYYCIKDYFAGGKKQASKGDVVQALRGLPIMGLGVKANEYFIPVNTIKQNPDWSEEDETALSDALWAMKQAAKIAKDENDMGNIWYAENWLKSIKDRMKGE